MGLWIQIKGSTLPPRLHPREEGVQIRAERMREDLLPERQQQQQQQPQQLQPRPQRHLRFGARGEGERGGDQNAFGRDGEIMEVEEEEDFVVVLPSSSLDTHTCTPDPYNGS